MDKDKIVEVLKKYASYWKGDLNSKFRLLVEEDFEQITDEILRGEKK